MVQIGILRHQPLLSLTVLTILTIFLSFQVGAEKEAARIDVSRMSVPDIEEALQQCPLVQDLNRHRQASNPPTSGLTEQIFSFLFPGTPAVNALLATLYISGPPNFLLALCPPNIDPSSLSVMVAFAVGGLLGDTIFHLLPEIFLGEASPAEARFVLIEPNKNLLLGVAILVGFVTFVVMDKGLRIATGGEGGHDHSHGKESGSVKEEKDSLAIAETSGASPDLSQNGLKSRKNTAAKTTQFSNIAEIRSLPHDLLQKIQTYEEPKRSRLWLRAVLEEDAESDITQIALWQAYKTQLGEPYLSAAHFIRNMSRIFAGAEAQTVDNKYVVKGIRPRSQAMTLQQHEDSLSNRKQTPSPPPTQSTPNPAAPPAPPAPPSIRLSAYLNLIADFTHNITDGLALSSSFYASPTLGATTTAAVFFHEIPHEVGDFALLIQSGFGKKRAMAAQFVTALGALLGTLLGIAVQELGKKGDAGRSGSGGVQQQQEQEVLWKGLAGTGLGWGDLLLPFTAGTFLYVGTVAVIPELLVTGADARAEVKKTGWQFAAMALGAGIMLAISWS